MMDKVQKPVIPRNNSHIKKLQCTYITKKERLGVKIKVTLGSSIILEEGVCVCVCVYMRGRKHHGKLSCLKVR